MRELLFVGGEELLFVVGGAVALSLLGKALSLLGGGRGSSVAVAVEFVIRWMHDIAKGR